MREIEVRPIKGVRGEREIIVDGNLWGGITGRSHGCYGSSYQFHQWLGAPNDWQRIERNHVQVEFRPQKPDRYDRAVLGRKARPLDDQLRDCVASLIEEGDLRDPAIVAAETAEATRIFNERATAAAEAEAREFRECAAACLRPLAANFFTVDGVIQELVIAEIVKAMRWAQTQ